jgi:ABC-type amino acid transport substrate-binding protein
MLNAAGEPAGMLVDMWRLWAKKTGHPIEFKPGTWPETLDSLNNGQADIHSGLFFNNQRETWLDFSVPFYQIDSRLFYARASGDSGGVILRPGQKVGVVTGSYQEQYLRQYYPQVEVTLFDDHRAMIFAVRQKNIVAFIGETLTLRITSTNLAYSGEIVGADEVLAVNPVHAAVLKGNDPC